MPPLIGFFIENSVANSAPIFLSALAFAYIGGPFIKNLGANKYYRSGAYTIIGVVAGMWSYSSLSIPERSIETLEAITLSIGMLIYSSMFIIPVVLFKNRDK